MFLFMFSMIMLVGYYSGGVEPGLSGKAGMQEWKIGQALAPRDSAIKQVLGATVDFFGQVTWQVLRIGVALGEKHAAQNLHYIDWFPVMAWIVAISTVAWEASSAFFMIVLPPLLALRERKQQKRRLAILADLGGPVIL